jgi:hypothetical protein
MQMSPLQTAPATLQVPAPPLGLTQHGLPSSPHLAQLPPVHLVSGAVHTPAPELEAQQGKPGPPQGPHAPAEHVPPPRPTQVAPTDMQMLVTQQPPLLQPLPSQHGMPASPQATTTVVPPAPGCAPPAPGCAPPAPVMPPCPWIPPPP